MKNLLLIIPLLCCYTLLFAQNKIPKMKTVFNGKNFKKWKEPKDNIYWRIRDDVLFVKNGPNKKGSIL